nr:M48 family metalloprotease [Candidatus Sigynarchaeota archaeon]
VWRFISPQYITLALYLLAWLLVATTASLFNFNMFEAIYPVLLVMIVIIYFSSGFFIDKFLGVKPVSKIDEKKRERLVAIVDQVKERLNFKTRVKVGYGNYPIINAMAYGSFIDKRICIIAPDDINLPEDELAAVIAHELGHLKLKHPLYLMGINAIDLVIRWIFNIPATYYDFAFGRKFEILGVDVGIFGFIILNMVIFAFLYLFVRVMEAHADFVVKRAGMGRDLAKALYNLESFYALGQQVGLNVMLLADEKVDDEHRMLDYITAARALRGQLVKPSRSLAVSTLLNSHPPSFLRIANAMLPVSSELGAWEATFILAKIVRKKNLIKFSSRVNVILPELDAITKAKFNEEFGSVTGGNLAMFLKSLKLHGQKPRLLNNQVLFTNKLTGQVSHVRVNEVTYNDSITNPFIYNVVPVGGSGPGTIDPVLHKHDIINAGEHYKAGKDGVLVLERIEQKKKKPKITCIFKDEKGNKVETPFNDVKNQITPEFIQSLKNKDLFIEHDEAYDVA